MERVLLFNLEVITDESARKILRSLERDALSCSRRDVFSFLVRFFIFSVLIFSCSYLCIYLLKTCYLYI